MSLKSNSLSMLIEKKRGRIAEELARFEEAAAVLEMVPRKAGLRIPSVLDQIRNLLSAISVADP
jgi:hypothetical protein